MADKAPRNNAHCTIPDDPDQSTYRFIIVAAKRAAIAEWCASVSPNHFQEAHGDFDGRSPPRAGEVLATRTSENVMDDFGHSCVC
jgi:hypothetical protein